MKKKRDNIYLYYQRLVKDKDTALLSFMDSMLAKTATMFVWKNLPDTIPPTALEELLQTNGNCFVTEVEGALYALQGVAGGEPDVYNRPTIYTVANAALKLSHNYDLNNDGVYIENDTNGNGLLDLIGKYAVLYVDGVISLNTATVLSRITMLISASDDKTKQSADEFITKIQNGDFSVIGENAFFKGVNLQTAPVGTNTNITQYIEAIQYIKASLLNEIGLNANFNMKRERLNLGEVTMNNDILLPYVDNMLSCRQRAAERINEKYGTDIAVMLGSSWKLEHENFEALAVSTETDNANVAPADDETAPQNGSDPEPTQNDPEPNGTDEPKGEPEPEPKTEVK